MNASRIRSQCVSCFRYFVVWSFNIVSNVECRMSNLYFLLSLRRLSLYAICLLLCLTPGVSGAGAGQTGLAFLKLDVGARSAGLGGAYTAVASDATALYWNPARMTTMIGTDVTIIHTQWFQDVSHEFIGAVASNGTSAIGLGFMLMTVDGIERRTDIPTARPLATFNAYDVMLSGSYARQITETISAGITIKGIAEKILFDTASGLAVDLGVQYRTVYDGLTIGGSIRHIGSKLSFIREQFDLPREIRIGAAYVPTYAALQRRVLLSADIGKYRAEPIKLNLGAEYTYRGRFSTSLGYRTRQDEAGVSAGLGVRLQRYRLDYAFVPFGADLGNTHRFALGLRF